MGLGFKALWGLNIGADFHTQNKVWGILQYVIATAPYHQNPSNIVL